MKWPHDPAEYDRDILNAVRAFDAGKASADQQIMVKNWLLHAVCRVEGMSYHHGGEDGRRASDFAEGKRYVANQFRKMLNPITVAAQELSDQRAKGLQPIRGKRQAK